MTLKVMIKEKYGRELIYPANDLAIWFVEDVMKKKTFSREILENFKKNGFKVKFVSGYSLDAGVCDE